MQVEMGVDFLPELDRKLTQIAVVEAFEKYRIYKFITFEEREASITASATPRYHGPTNQTSDQTGDIASYNVDERERRRRYCEKVERTVNRLPPLEKTLLTERYMGNDSDYITDQTVYNHRFNPPISKTKYERVRWKAFYKFALNMDIAVEKQSRKGE